MKQVIHSTRIMRIAISMFVSTVMLLTLVALLALIFLNANIDNGLIKYLKPLVLVLISAIGAGISIRGGEKIGIYSGLYVALFSLELVFIGVIILEGEIESIIISIFAIIIGAAVSCANCLRKRNISRKRKKAIW